jgi:hypothetical protein
VTAHPTTAPVDIDERRIRGYLAVVLAWPPSPQSCSSP